MNNKISIESLYHSLAENLRKYIAVSVRDRQLAEDIFQQIFLKIILKLDSIQDKEKVHSWIFTIMRNTIIDALRKHKPTSELDETQIANEKEQENFSNDETQTRHAIKALIDTFPPLYRDVLILHELDGIPIREIARQQSLSLSAARSRVQRGKKMLKEKLKEFCVFELDRFGYIINYTLSEKARDYLKKMNIF